MDEESKAVGYVECAQDVWLEADDALEWLEESAMVAAREGVARLALLRSIAARCQLAKDVTDPSTERSRTWTLVWSKDHWICS